MSIIQRVEFLLNSEGSQTKFAKKTGLKVQTIAGLMNRGALFIRSDTLEAIISAYPDLNARWLITGEGEMWGSGQGSLAIGGTKDTSHRSNFLVPVPAQAGYTPDWGQERGQKGLETVIIPGVLGEARTWEVSGNSMSPLIEEGDWVSGNRVESLAKLIGGQIIVLVTRTQGVQIKHAWAQGTKVRLMPANFNFPIFEIDAQEVVEMWDVRCRVTANVMLPPSAVAHAVDPSEVRWMLPVVRVVVPEEGKETEEKK